ATCGHEPRPGTHQVGQDGAGIVLDHGARGDEQLQIRTIAAGAHIALALRAVRGALVWGVVEVQQRGGLRVHHQDDVATRAAVGAAGPAQGFELLPPYRGTAVPAVATAGVQHHAIDETGHLLPPQRARIYCPGAETTTAGVSDSREPPPPPWRDVKSGVGDDVHDLAAAL